MSKPLAKEMSADVVRAIQDHYFGETPAPKYVSVDLKTVRADRVDPSYFCAKVAIEVEHVGKKTQKHTVHIRFRLDAKKRLVTSSISYL